MEKSFFLFFDYDYTTHEFEGAVLFSLVVRGETQTHTLLGNAERTATWRDPRYK